MFLQSNIGDFSPCGLSQMAQITLLYEDREVNGPRGEKAGERPVRAGTKG